MYSCVRWKIYSCVRWEMYNCVRWEMYSCGRWEMYNCVRLGCTVVGGGRWIVVPGVRCTVV